MSARSAQVCRTHGRSGSATAFAFRDRYLALCRKWGLDPAAVAVEYAFRLGFDAVALNTSNPKRVVQNAHYGAHRSPESFWSAL